MAEVETKAELSFTDSELKVLRQEYAKLTDIEFDAYLGAAHRYRLNPLANQIHARLQEATAKNPRSVTYMTQIDGYRLIADRTGQYAGNDDPIYEAGPKAEYPAKATTTVHKIVDGQSRAFTASARWAEYFPGGNAGFMWARMPFLMLGKCAEALALRKAFPAELAGLYVVEELQQRDSGPAEKPASSKPAAGKTTSSTKPPANFSHPPGWPDTPAPRLAKWIAALPNFTALTVALGIFENEPALVNHLADWETVMRAIADQYKVFTENFTKNRSKEFEGRIRANIDAIKRDKAAQ